MRYTGIIISSARLVTISFCLSSQSFLIFLFPRNFFLITCNQRILYFSSLSPAAIWSQIDGISFQSSSTSYNNDIKRKSLKVYGWVARNKKESVWPIESLTKQCKTHLSFANNDAIWDSVDTLFGKNEYISYTIHKGKGASVENGRLHKRKQ